MKNKQKIAEMVKIMKHYAYTRELIDEDEICVLDEDDFELVANEIVKNSLTLSPNDEEVEVEQSKLFSFEDMREAYKAGVWGKNEYAANEWIETYVAIKKQAPWPSLKSS